MHLAIYLPLLCTAIFGQLAPTLARRLPPAAGTWLLSAGGLLAATASAAYLTLLAPLVGESPRLAARAHWSDQTLRHANPVPTPVAAAALVVLALLAVRVAVAAARRACASHETYRLAATLCAPAGDLAVLDSAEPHAYAVPGRPGRIVVSTGLLRRLDAHQRRALLEHERAHLTGHHHWHHTAARLAAAANPLLHQVPAGVTLTCETLGRPGGRRHQSARHRRRSPAARGQRQAAGLRGATGRGGHRPGRPRRRAPRPGTAHALGTHRRSHRPARRSGRDAGRSRARHRTTLRTRPGHLPRGPLIACHGTFDFCPRSRARNIGVFAALVMGNPGVRTATLSTCVTVTAQNTARRTSMTSTASATTVVLRKDNDVLRVNATGLPAVGSSGMNRRCRREKHGGGQLTRRKPALTR